MAVTFADEPTARQKIWLADTLLPLRRLTFRPFGSNICCVLKQVCMYSGFKHSNVVVVRRHCRTPGVPVSFIPVQSHLAGWSHVTVAVVCS